MLRFKGILKCHTLKNVPLTSSLRVAKGVRVRLQPFVRNMASEAAPVKKSSFGKKLTVGVVGFLGVSYLISAVGDPLPSTPADRPYHWISPEAEELIARNYERHSILSDASKDTQEVLTVEQMREMNIVLESMGNGPQVHYEPQTVTDSAAASLMYFLEYLMGCFFREKYDHHAVTLETLAAVPGIVAAGHRHLRSLRVMDTDHGWINPLQEEAENERMHLLIWMEVTQPTWVERQFVILSQGLYLIAYSTLYTLSPRTAHRMVGYLEEAAFAAYTEYYAALKNGDIADKPAPLLARHYYRLPREATVKDVVLRVRADECMHRDFNHELSDMHRYGLQGETPHFMSTEVGKLKVPAGPWWRSDTGTLLRRWSDKTASTIKPRVVPKELQE